MLENDYGVCMPVPISSINLDGSHTLKINLFTQIFCANFAMLSQAAKFLEVYFGPTCAHLFSNILKMKILFFGGP